MAETLAYDYWRQHGVNICIARIFNTYGPRMLENDGRVVSNFVRQALCGEPLTLYGDGSQTRSFCYVSETIDGCGPIAMEARKGNHASGDGGGEKFLLSRLVGRSHGLHMYVGS